MHKEAGWLLTELPALVEKGIVDAAAAERLRAHYADAPGVARLGWGTLLLATGGAALIGLGVILIFAHNWESWTPGMRVGLSLLPLLVGQLAAVWALRSGARAAREAAGLFTAVAAGASIALVAQTYQFGGDLPRFLMTWLLLSAPLVYLLDASAVAALCWGLATAWVVVSPHDGWWSQGDGLREAMRLPVFLALFAIPLPHLVRQLRVDRTGARVAWLLRMALLAAIVGLWGAAAHDEEAMPMVYAALAAACALAGQRWFAGSSGLWGNPLQTVGLVGVAVLMLGATVDRVLVNFSWPATPVMLLALLGGIAAAWIAWREFAAGDRLLAPLLGLVAPLLYLLPGLAHTSGAGANVLVHLYVLALVAALVRKGLRTARLGLANAGVALLAALILLRFFDSQLSYVVRGVGFIVTGVGFFVAILWLRRRVRGGP